MLYEDDPQMLNTSMVPKHFVDFVTITASGYMRLKLLSSLNIV